MVLNEIIRGAAGISVAARGVGDEGHSTSKADLKAAAVSVMEEYTSLSNWHLITVSEETDRDRQDRQVCFYWNRTTACALLSRGAFRFNTTHGLDASLFSFKALIHFFKEMSAIYSGFPSCWQLHVNLRLLKCIRS